MVARCSANLATASESGTADARPDTRVRITVCDTSGLVSSALITAAAAVNDDTPGTISYSMPSASSRRICSAVAP